MAYIGTAQLCTSHRIAAELRAETSMAGPVGVLMQGAHPWVLMYCS